MHEVDQRQSMPDPDFLRLEIGLLREDQLFYVKEMQGNERVIFLAISAIYAFYLNNPQGLGMDALLIFPPFLVGYGWARAIYIWGRLDLNVRHCAQLEDFFGHGKLGIARNFINVRKNSDSHRWARKNLWWTVLVLAVFFSVYCFVSGEGVLATTIMDLFNET